MSGKRQFKGLIITIVLLALITIVAFSITGYKSSSFYITYFFTVVSIIIQNIIWKVAFKSSRELKSKFLGISVVSIGLIYLVIQFAVFTVMIFKPIVSQGVALIINSLLLGFTIICLIFTDESRNVIETIEIKRVEDRKFIDEIYSLVQIYIIEEKDGLMKSKLLKLADDIRYSDPVSNSKLCEIEKSISAKISEFRNATDKEKIINEITSLLAERNIRCKMYK